MTVIGEINLYSCFYFFPVECKSIKAICREDWL